MKIKYWNWIYFLGFVLPVFAFFGSYVAVALSDGSSNFVDGSLWNSINNAISQVSNINLLMPVTQLARIIVGVPILQFGIRLPFIACFTYGCDFVLWLGIMHIVLDVFMLMTNCLSKLFNKFGGAD